MRTAVDTNVLFDVLIDDPEYATPARSALTAALEAGPLVVCPVVYGELAARVSDLRDLDGFLDDLSIQLDPLTPETLGRAGQAWRHYARTRGQRVQCPQRGHQAAFRCPSCQAPIAWRQHLIPDFLIGAHAAVQADALLTRDRGYYGSYFPELRLQVPG